MTRHWLAKLGADPKQTVVILHVDDLGMCGATLTAYSGILASGLPCSASLMVPCPWFPATAAMFRRDRRADLGVHVTLTSEWEGYRWGPVSTRDPRSGLLDAGGFLPRGHHEAVTGIRGVAGRREIRAQVARAYAAGIDVSHLDVHMGPPFHHKFLPAYLGEALRRRIPAFIPRVPEAELRKWGSRRLLAAVTSRFGYPFLERRQPLFDGWTGLAMGPRDRFAVAVRRLSALGPGLFHVISHPATDTPELRAICADWEVRVAELRALTNPAFRRALHRAGIRLIRYRDLRRLVRNRQPS